MKYSILVREDDFSIKLANTISSKITYEKDEINPDVVVVVGGDGTMLRAVKRYFHLIDKIIFYGINTGHLGFYSNWSVDEIDSFIYSINHGVDKFDYFNLLEYKINNGDTQYAINEITVRNNYVVDEFDVMIDNELFEVFRGTGLCCSTTNGSTALSKSLGGSVIDTAINAFQLSEIASVNSNAYRTLGSAAVFLGSRTLEIKKSASNQIMITADQDVYDIDFLSLIVTLSNKKVKFAKNKHSSFWNRVKKSFI